MTFTGQRNMEGFEWVFGADGTLARTSPLDIMISAERGRPPVENAGWPRRSQGRIMSTWSLVVNREVSHETL